MSFVFWLAKQHRPTAFEGMKDAIFGSVSPGSAEALPAAK